MGIDVSLAVDARAVLGECPRWDEELQRLVWIEVRSGELNLFDPDTGDNVVHRLGREVGSVALHEDGSFFVALRDGFGMFHPERRLRLLLPVDAGDLCSRLY